MKDSSNGALFIKGIRQVDNHTFKIDWSDGKEVFYRLFDLQRNCPCAGCQTSKDLPKVNEDVKAVKIRSVGRYALQIQFTSGCSNGIFDFAFLRRKLAVSNSTLREYL